MNRSIRLVGILLVAIGVGGAAALYLNTGQVTFRADASAALLARLQQLALIAAVIERVVEVYLKASNQNGEDRHDSTDTSGADAQQPATWVGLLLGALVAICGLRVLDSFVTLPNANPQDLQHVIWTGIDVVLTAGLLAGGAYILHEVSETITGGIKYIDPLRTETEKAKAEAQKAKATPDPGETDDTPPAEDKPEPGKAISDTVNDAAKQNAQAAPDVAKQPVS